MSSLWKNRQSQPKRDTLRHSLASPVLMECPEPPALASVPKLRTPLSDDIFPDDLLVHDTHNLTGGATSSPIHYARVYPVSIQDTTNELTRKHGRASKVPEPRPRNVAHLFLGAAVEVGRGQVATTHRAPLTLSSHPENKTFAVVAKLARGTCGAHRRLLQEAGVLNGIFRLVELDFRGLTSAFAAGIGGPDPKIGSSPAWLPQFYGFYVPVGEDGEARVQAHDEGCDEKCEGEVSWMTPILLLEECEDSIRVK